LSIARIEVRKEFIAPKMQSSRSTAYAAPTPRTPLVTPLIRWLSTYCVLALATT